MSVLFGDASKFPLVGQFQIGKALTCGYHFRASGGMIKKGGGKPRSVRTPENINAVRRSFHHSPKRSARKTPELFSYLIGVCVEFCSMICDFIHTRWSLFKNSFNNPRELHEKPLHKTVLLYGAQLQESGYLVLTSALQIDQVWFQQDGASSHTAQISLQVLRQIFPGRLISSRGDVRWLALSLDLAPCDFFLWGQLKAEVFKHRPRTLSDIRNAIQEEIGLIPQEMLVRVMQKFRSRIGQCIDSEGQHLRDTLFYDAVSTSLACEWDESENAGEMSPESSTDSYSAFAHIGLS
ncbi:hypothetical protein ANN_22620 [Periplaneta americana]|uniref:Uncharacterized protein n=1 Tax=Periplaneta americana TaxID=6978 RepID=A0ABQ8S8M6_PERAM|nr:hypothetical protein ANN_22620 [Periplaneta americana]